MWIRIIKQKLQRMIGRGTTVCYKFTQSVLKRVAWYSNDLEGSVGYRIWQKVSRRFTPCKYLRAFSSLRMSTKGKNNKWWQIVCEGVDWLTGNLVLLDLLSCTSLVDTSHGHSDWPSSTEEEGEVSTYTMMLGTLTCRWQCWCNNHVPFDTRVPLLSPWFLQGQSPLSLPMSFASVALSTAWDIAWSGQNHLSQGPLLAKNIVTHLFQNGGIAFVQTELHLVRRLQLCSLVLQINLPLC